VRTHRFHHADDEEFLPEGEAEHRSEIDEALPEELAMHLVSPDDEPEDQAEILEALAVEDDDR
jgi:hypothetical protein